MLVHGLSANRLLMWPLAKRLRKAGFGTLNWGYRSTTRSTRWHAERLAGVLSDLQMDPGISRLHLVGHSMGAIVVRSVLQEGCPEKLGRVVMLAPPNRGSHVARWVAPAVRWFCPTMSELTDDVDSYVNRLRPRLECEFGIIAASRDRVIRPANTRLDGQRDHAVVASHHGILPWHRDCQDKVLAFLETGCFLPEPSRGTAPQVGKPVLDEGSRN